MDNRKLGEILLDAGVITQEQLMKALQDQRILGGRLGTILMDSCIISRDDYVRAMTSRLGIEAIDLTAASGKA